MDKMRGREPITDVVPRRVAHYEEAFGRPRVSHLPGINKPEGREEKRVPALPAVEVEIEERVEVDIEGERQWLGLGDDYGYGLGYIRKEKSEGLEAQIERELERRGFTTRS